MRKISHVPLIAATAIPLVVAVVSAGILARRQHAPAVKVETQAQGGAEDVGNSTTDPKSKDDRRAASDPLKKVAVTAERFDAVGRLLDELGPGYEYEVIEETALRDPKACARFSAVFLTCSDHGGAAADGALIDGLRQYVAAGGTLYASDLRFDLVAAAFPDRVDRRFVAQGLKQELRASVVSHELRALVGSEVPLHFWVDPWRPAAFRGDDVTVLLKGRLQSTAGVALEAPLLVQFPYDRGTVIFTSFHHDRRNTADETKLLRFLALKTVTAALESRASEQLVDEGYSVLATVATSAVAGGPPVARSYQLAKAGPLRFVLRSAKPGAKLRLEVVGPKGKTRIERGESTIALDLPRAAAGQWRYSAALEAAPYPETPSVLIVAGAGEAGLPLVEKANPSLPAETGGNVRFEEVALGNKPAAAPARNLKIAVTPPKFDDMGRLLRALGDGYQYDEIGMDALLDPNALQRFDILFLTCDGYPAEWGVITGTSARGMASGRMKDDVAEKLKRSLGGFVRNGGTLYVSDLHQYLIEIVFPKRAVDAENVRNQVKEIDPDAVRQLQAAESDWIKTVTPTVTPETLADVLATAGLGKELTADLDRVVVALERSPMVKDMPGLSRGRKTTNLYELFLNQRVVPPPNEPNNIFELLLRQNGPRAPVVNFEVSEPRVQQVLERFGLRPQPGDVSAIANALSRWKSGINTAARQRTFAKIKAAWPQITTVSNQLLELRGRLLKNDHANDDTPGRAGQSVDAQVVDPGLKDLLGEQLRLRFNDDYWRPASFAGEDVKVLLRGSYTGVDSEPHSAPLLVKFRQGKGTVIFTSFHNEAQNSKEELDLLRYLVFTAVTAQEDAVALESMLSAGFSPVKQSQNSHAAGHPTVTKTYDSPSADPLRFALTFNGRGARLRLTLVAPNGAKFEKEVESTLIVQAAGAPAGEWTYTVDALQVPYENFPYNVSIGTGAVSGPKPRKSR